jgi:transposase
LALRRFVGIGLDEYTPDHSTISRTRRLIDLDRHREVFRWGLGILADRGLQKGQRIAIDATILKRQLLHVSAFNLGLILRKMLGARRVS